MKLFIMIVMGMNAIICMISAILIVANMSKMDDGFIAVCVMGMVFALLALYMNKWRKGQSTTFNDITSE